MTQDSPNIDVSPQDPLLEVGTTLRELREQQHLSLESLAAQTKIQRRLLVAIEAGDWSDLPEPVYVQGFIRRYADILGADGNALAQKIPMAPVVKVPTQSTQDFRLAAGLRPSHLYGVYLVLIVGAVWGLSMVLQRSGTQSPPIPAASAPSPSPSASPAASPSPSPSASAAQPSSSPTPENSETSTAAASESPAVEEEIANPAQGWLGSLKLPDAKSFTISGKPVNVAVKLTGQAWIRIVVDGKVEFEGVLPEGTDRTWAADKALIVRSGNAGAVQVGFNGDDPKPLGEKGAVQEVSFSAEGAENS